MKVQTPPPEGHIRAFDVRTGKLQWIFHTIPYPGEPGYDTWEDTAAYKHIGGVNAWSGFYTGPGTRYFYLRQQVLRSF